MKTKISALTAVIITLALSGCGSPPASSVNVAKNLEKNNNQCVKIVTGKIISYENSPLTINELSESRTACAYYDKIKLLYKKLNNENPKKIPLKSLIPHPYLSMSQSVINDMATALYDDNITTRSNYMFSSAKSFTETNLGFKQTIKSVPELYSYWKELIISH